MRTDTAKQSMQAREHILYVDDEKALVSLAKRLLERRGYRVSGFTEAVIALQLFRERPRDFDAVVTDLSMLGISCFELGEEIHRTRADILCCSPRAISKPRISKRRRARASVKLSRSPEPPKNWPERSGRSFSGRAERA